MPEAAWRTWDPTGQHALDLLGGAVERARDILDALRGLGLLLLDDLQRGILCTRPMPETSVCASLIMPEMLDSF